MDFSPCLLIDDDQPACTELQTLLSARGYLAEARPSVQAAARLLTEPRMNLLFIRISEWDHYQRLTYRLPYFPRTVVFLSARSDSCTGTLSAEVDFHLQPPYRDSALRKILARIRDPAFHPRRLDFFFLRCHCQFYAIDYAALQRVHSHAKTLTIVTDRGEYEITGSLAGFEARLPMGAERVRRNLLVMNY